MYMKVLTFHFTCLYGLCSRSQELKVQKTINAMYTTQFHNLQIDLYLKPNIVLRDCGNPRSQARRKALGWRTTSGHPWPADTAASRRAVAISNLPRGFEIATARWEMAVSAGYGIPCYVW